MVSKSNILVPTTILGSGEKVKKQLSGKSVLKYQYKKEENNVTFKINKTIQPSGERKACITQQQSALG